MRYLLIVSVLIFSCTRSAKISRTSPCYNQLKSELKGNWKPSKDSSYFIVTEKLLVLLDSVYKSCILSLNKNQIISLFGKPTVIQSPAAEFHYPYALSYLITPPCDASHGYTECSYYIFSLDSIFKVKRCDHMFVQGVVEH